jgi:hypothetical protein
MRSLEKPFQKISSSPIISNIYHGKLILMMITVGIDAKKFTIRNKHEFFLMNMSLKDKS